jgi:lipopolysaccharide export system protein LptA
MTLFFSSNTSRAVVILAAAVMVAGVAAVDAQQPAGPPNALQGFSQNRDKPIKINSNTLEVRDKDKMATFAGDVHLVQGDVDMRSSTLVVFYDDQPPPAQATPAQPKGGKAPAASAQITPQQQQNQQIKRVEAKGSVTVRVPEKNQTATGDQGIFDMRANTVTMQGSVVITQGTNIIRGDTLVVNMNTGDSTLTCAAGKAGCGKDGRVQLLLDPNAAKQQANPPTPPAQARPAARPRAPQPQPPG